MRIVFTVVALLLAAAGLPAQDPEDMVAFLKKQVAAHPADVEAHVRLVETLIQRERFDEADDALKTALAANAQASEIHRVQGDLLFREGNVFEADTAYKAAYRLDQKNPLAVYGIARTFRVAALRAKAAVLIREAHKLDPENEEISTAFYALDNSAAGAVALWEKALQNPLAVADPDRKLYIETELAEARLLHGDHPFELASPYRHYQLPYRVLYNGRRATGVGETISINGVKSELRVDTGASGVTVSSGFAAKAGIQRIGSSKMTGVGNEGNAATWIGYAERMQIGDLEFKNVIVDVKEKGSVDDSGGLLGTDIFRRFLVKLNFHQGRIDLDPLPGPAWDGFTPVDRYEGPEIKEFTQILQVHHHLFIPTMVSEKQKSEQTSCLFLVDTGASLNNISTNLASSVTKVRDNYSMIVKGVSGRVKMLYQADQVVLQFARFKQSNLNLAAFDLGHLSRSAGFEVGGILGLPVLSLFQSVTIDYRDGKIDFDYKP